MDQRHAFERYSKFRALYEKAKKEGRLDFLAEDVVDLLAGACSPAYYEYVAAEKAKKEPKPEKQPDTFDDLPAPHAAAAGGDVARLKMLGRLEASLLSSFDAAHRWYDDWIWNIILTPNYNLAHDNHFHVDLSPGSHYVGATDGRYIGPALYVD